MKWDEMTERERDMLVFTTVMGAHGAIEPPRYTTDISAAWAVVEKMKHLSPCVNWLDVPHSPVGWHACIDNHHVHGCDSAPKAICKAALKAMGVEIE